jgi:PAS domain S-box-containing protein
MNIDLWALAGGFQLGLPLRPSAYVLAAFSLLTLLWILRATIKQSSFLVRRPSGRPWIAWGGIAVLVPLASGLLWVQWDVPGAAAPGILPQQGMPLLIFFGALPWMLAAGILSAGEAALVGLAAGAIRAGWGTHSLLTPLFVSFEAYFVAWLLRRDYDDWFGAGLRNPIFSGIAGAAIFALLRSLDRLAYSSGTIYDGLDYSLTLLGPTLLTAGAEALIAGTLGEALRRAVPGQWYAPKRLTAPPYRRSLAARLITVYVVLGVLASGFLLYGDWLLAYASARESVEREMRQTAAQASEDVPYFVQTGRSLVRQFADDIVPGQESPAELNARLESQLRFTPFFVGLSVYDPDGIAIARAPKGTTELELASDQVRYAIELALNGIPQEIVVPGESPQGESARLVFVSPIRPAGSSAPTGALAGAADLGTNPVLFPAVRRLSGISPGQAFIVDGSGQIILSPGDRAESWLPDLGRTQDGRVVTETGPDGTRWLVYFYPVPSFPWGIVLAVPLRVVNSLAVPIAVRLFVVIVLVGAALLAAVYLISRRLTRPLRQMAGVAESIARGDLARPVRGSGEDEIGRLSSSFERMRHSLRDRLDEMALVLQVSQSLASSFKLDESLPPLMAGVRDITKADLVRLVLRPAGPASPAELETYSDGEDPGGWSHLDTGILALCGDKGQFVLENPRRARAVLDVESLQEPIEALMGIPISTEGQYVGALWVGHRDPHRYGSDELNLLSIVSSQLGVSLANARLFQMAEQERTLLSAIQEATPEAVVVTDQRGAIVLANPAAEKVLGVEPHQAWGKPVEDVVQHPALLELLRGSGTDVHAAEVRFDEGRVLFGTAQDIKAGRGGQARRVCVLWDITHFKMLDALKSEFVATVSHDLKTPLTLMRGYGAMLPMVGSMSGQQKELVGKILSSVDRMARLVDDLLDLGRIEAGIALEVDRVELRDLLSQLIEDYRPQANNKGIQLQLDLADEHQALEADEALLRQAISNLVDNAIKFHPSSGFVMLRAFQEDGRQLIQVRDDGPGIAATDQARLFEKFYKVMEGETAARGGTGLGLAIVKSIVERHHGSIHLESQLGVGSTFTLDLPRQQPESSEPSLGAEVQAR